MSENIPKAGESLPPSYNAAMGQPEVTQGHTTPQANPQETLFDFEIFARYKSLIRLQLVRLFCEL